MKEKIISKAETILQNWTSPYVMLHSFSKTI